MSALDSFAELMALIEETDFSIEQLRRDCTLVDSVQNLCQYVGASEAIISIEEVYVATSG